MFCKTWLRRTNDTNKPLFEANIVYALPSNYNTSSFDFQRCAQLVVDDHFEYLGIRDNRFCYGLENLPSATTKNSTDCKPCARTPTLDYSTNLCGSFYEMSIYIPSNIRYFAPPSPDTPDSAPPDFRRRLR